MKAKLIENFTYLKPKDAKEIKLHFDKVIDEIYWAICLKHIMTCKQLIEKKINMEEIEFVCKTLGSDPEDVILVHEGSRNLEHHKIILNFFNAVYEDMRDGEEKSFRDSNGKVTTFVFDKKNKVVYWWYSFMTGWFVDLLELKKRFKVNEGFTHLKPKTQKEIDNAIDLVLDEVVDVLIAQKLFRDYLEAYEYVEGNRKKITELVENGESVNGIADYLWNGAWKDESDYLKFDEDNY